MKNRHLKKFNNLLKKHQHQQPPTENTIDKSKWTVNLSSETLTPAEENLLQNGLNYSITPQTIPTADIIAKVETAIRTLPDGEEVENIRAKTSLILLKKNFQRKTYQQNKRKPCTHYVKTTLSSFFQLTKVDKLSSSTNKTTLTNAKIISTTVPTPKFKKIQQNQLRKKPDKNYLS